MNRIRLLKTDITTLGVDAIVNAANRTLLGGGGVDGAIHEAAGRGLFLECVTLGGCQVGEAKITGAYRLPAKYVIHTVGPSWGAYDGQESDRLLAGCYRNSLELAVKHDVKTIAFPNISTGVYGFPKDRAAPVAFSAVQTFLVESAFIETVYFVCFDDENYQLYAHIMKHGA
jgi:O-acetyl-ADP-ribose deacetylase (regulator of RNase III)